MMGMQQYILIPRQGMGSRFNDAQGYLRTLPDVQSTQPPQTTELAFAVTNKVQVLDSALENGPKLVAMDSSAAASVNAGDTPIRAVPVVEYDHPDTLPFTSLMSLPGPDNAAVAPEDGIKILCLDAETGKPIANVRALAVSNAGPVAKGASDENGGVVLTVSGNVIDRLYLACGPMYWGAYLENLPVDSEVTEVKIRRVALPYHDAVKHYYSNSRFDLASGVRVSVIDTGVGPHHALNVVGGLNTVHGESAQQFKDWKGHGTHVAGLIGAIPSASGVRGLAPGIPINAFRVFGSNGKGASNYAILKAMIYSATGAYQSDIINLSLGGGPYDEIVENAMADACDQGIVVVVASGNGGRQAVQYPAAYSDAIAVSAFGRLGCFPADSLPAGDIMTPPSSPDFPDEFIARFSNVGPQISVMAPGVGVISTLPGDSFGPNSGTSMAAPVVAGAIACLLSRDGAILQMPRERARSEAIRKLLLTNCVARNFGGNFEGFGLPNPIKI